MWVDLVGWGWGIAAFFFLFEGRWGIAAETNNQFLPSLRTAHILNAMESARGPHDPAARMKNECNPIFLSQKDEIGTKSHGDC